MSYTASEFMFETLMKNYSHYLNKNNINVYAKSNNALERRKELSDEILKSDVYLPDSILHDDLDLGMLEYVKKYFIVNSNGSQIPIIPKILTILIKGKLHILLRKKKQKDKCFKQYYVNHINLLTMYILKS